MKPNQLVQLTPIAEKLRTLAATIEEVSNFVRRMREKALLRQEHASTENQVIPLFTRDEL